MSSVVACEVDVVARTKHPEEARSKAVEDSQTEVVAVPRLEVGVPRRLLELTIRPEYYLSTLASLTVQGLTGANLCLHNWPTARSNCHRPLDINGHS